MSTTLELWQRLLLGGSCVIICLLLAMLAIIMSANLRESGEATRFEVFCMMVILLFSAAASLLMATASFYAFFA